MAARSPSVPPLTPLGDSAATTSTTIALELSSPSAAPQIAGSKDCCNVQVVCRFRPAREEDPFAWVGCSDDGVCVSIGVGWWHVHIQLAPRNRPKSICSNLKSQVNIRTPERMLDFAFDKVFHCGATQADVYESVRHVVLGVMDGFNGTLLAYGQVRMSGGDCERFWPDSSSYHNRRKSRLE